MTSWLEISDVRLAANYRAIAQTAGAQTSVLAVVKANAYGHGIELCSTILTRAGAPWLGVTSAAEGARARRALAAAGFAPANQPAILVMCGFLPQDVEAVLLTVNSEPIWTPAEL